MSPRLTPGPTPPAPPISPALLLCGQQKPVLSVSAPEPHACTTNAQNKAHLEKLCKDLRTAIYEASTETTQVTSKLALCEQDIKRLTEEEPLIVSELGSLEEEIAQSVQKEYDSKQRLEELEVVNNQRAAHIRELEAMVNELREQQQSRVAELTELKVQLGQVAEQQKGLRQIISSLENQIQTSQQTLTTTGAPAESKSLRPSGISWAASPRSLNCLSRKKNSSRATAVCRKSSPN